jgi:hypothetical protein
MFTPLYAQIQSLFFDRRIPGSNDLAAIPSEIAQDHKEITSCFGLSIDVISRFTWATPVVRRVFKDQFFYFAWDNLMLGDVFDVAGVPSEFMDFHKGKVSQSDTPLQLCFPDRSCIFHMDWGVSMQFTLTQNLESILLALFWSAPDKLALSLGSDASPVLDQESLSPQIH